MSLIAEHEVDYMKRRGSAYLLEKGFGRKRSIDIGYVNEETDCAAALAQFVRQENVESAKSDYRLFEPHVIRTIDEDKDNVLCFLGWKPYKLNE